MDADTAILCLILCFISGLRNVSSCNELSQTDICMKADKEIPFLLTRGPDNIVTEELFHSRFCDVFAIDTGQWYHSNIPMSTTCPDMYMCGTKYPIWLRGNNPEKKDGLINLTACLRAYDSCCLRTYNIVAVNCGATMAYCFEELPSGCHQRYCFNTHISSSSQTINETNTQYVDKNDHDHVEQQQNETHCDHVKNVTDTGFSRTQTVGTILLVFSALTLAAFVCFVAHVCKRPRDASYDASHRFPTYIAHIKGMGQGIKRKTLIIIRKFRPEYTKQYKVIMTDQANANSCASTSE